MIEQILTFLYFVIGFIFSTYWGYRLRMNYGEMVFAVLFWPLIISTLIAIVIYNNIQRYNMFKRK